uniref:Uncharacterized protein n=1 Tax=Anguilla anguilla TaxID=7936 RepID=A0A0E9QS10_ANGAN
MTAICCASPHFYIYLLLLWVFLIIRVAFKNGYCQHISQSMTKLLTAHDG